MEPWRIGAIEFFGSYSRGGFSRGYVKNKPNKDYYNDAYNSFIKQTENPLYKKIDFIAKDYTEIDPADYSGSVIYCDPPY